MWLSEKKDKNKRTLLVYYYREWAHGKLSFPCRKPMDEVADRHLKSLGLIKTAFEPALAELRVSLTREGIRLGKIYNGSWWGRSGLWFAEYKDHWFWLILSFLGGIIGALLVNGLTLIINAKK